MPTMRDIFNIELIRRRRRIKRRRKRRMRRKTRRRRIRIRRRRAGEEEEEWQYLKLSTRLPRYAIMRAFGLFPPSSSTDSIHTI